MSVSIIFVIIHFLPSSSNFASHKTQSTSYNVLFDFIATHNFHTEIFTILTTIFEKKKRNKEKKKML